MTQPFRDQRVAISPNLQLPRGKQHTGFSPKVCGRRSSCRLCSPRVMRLDREYGGAGAGCVRSQGRVELALSKHRQRGVKKGRWLGSEAWRPVGQGVWPSTCGVDSGHSASKGISSRVTTAEAFWSGNQQDLSVRNADVSFSD